MSIVVIFTMVIHKMSIQSEYESAFIFLTINHYNILILITWNYFSFELLLRALYATKLLNIEHFWIVL